MALLQNRPGIPHAQAPQPEIVISVEEGLAASSRLSEETRHNGEDIKPCIAAMLNRSFGRGEYPSRSDAAIAIACELRRIGQSHDETLNRLNNWDQHNETPIKYKDIVRTVGSAFVKDYTFGCNHRTLVPYCIGPEVCPFRRFINEPSAKIQPWFFVRVGWQHHLCGNEVLIYQVALPFLEITKAGGIGRRICANHRQIADACGITPRRVGSHLKALAAAGLVEYTPGLPRKWLGIASAIQRIAPTPRPTPDRLTALKEFRAQVKARDSPAPYTFRYLPYVGTFVTLYYGHFSTRM